MTYSRTSYSRMKYNEERGRISYNSDGSKYINYNKERDEILNREIKENSKNDGYDD